MSDIAEELNVAWLNSKLNGLSRTDTIEVLEGALILLLNECDKLCNSLEEQSAAFPIVTQSFEVEKSEIARELQETRRIIFLIEQEFIPLESKADIQFIELTRLGIEKKNLLKCKDILLKEREWRELPNDLEYMFENGKYVNIANKVQNLAEQLKVCKADFTGVEGKQNLIANMKTKYITLTLDILKTNIAEERYDGLSELYTAISVFQLPAAFEDTYYSTVFREKLKAAWNDKWTNQTGSFVLTSTEPVLEVADKFFGNISELIMAQDYKLNATASFDFKDILDGCYIKSIESMIPSMRHLLEYIIATSPTEAVTTIALIKTSFESMEAKLKNIVPSHANLFTVPLKSALSSLLKEHLRILLNSLPELKMLESLINEPLKVGAFLEQCFKTLSRLLEKSLIHVLGLTSEALVPYIDGLRKALSEMLDKPVIILLDHVKGANKQLHFRLCLLFLDFYERMTELFIKLEQTSWRFVENQPVTFTSFNEHIKENCSQILQIAFRALYSKFESKLSFISNFKQNRTAAKKTERPMPEFSLHPSSEAIALAEDLMGLPQLCEEFSVESGFKTDISSLLRQYSLEDKPGNRVLVWVELICKKMMIDVVEMVKDIGVLSPNNAKQLIVDLNYIVSLLKNFGIEVSQGLLNLVQSLSSA